MEQEEASFFLVLAFKSASFLGRLVLAFITTSCSIFSPDPNLQGSGEASMEQSDWDLRWEGGPGLLPFVP